MFNGIKDDCPEDGVTRVHGMPVHDLGRSIGFTEVFVYLCIYYLKKELNLKIFDGHREASTIFTLMEFQDSDADEAWLIFVYLCDFL